MGIFNKNKKRKNHDSGFEYETKITFSNLYDIPLDLVEKILSFQKHGENFWDNVADPTTVEDYKLMLLGAAIAYKNQHLMGRMLPPNDERVIELSKYLLSRGLAIQFHPEHGMRIVDVTGNMKENNDDMETTIEKRDERVKKHDGTKSKPNIKPEPFYYCTYGGIAPICSDCDRNHMNSVFRTEDVGNWYNPDHNSNFNICYGYIKQ